MHITDRIPWRLRRDITIWGLPVAASELWLGVAIGALMLATILFALRPFLRAILGIEAGL